MEHLTSRTNTISNINADEEKRIKELLPNFVFSNKKDGCSLSLKIETCVGRHFSTEDYSFKFKIKDLKTSYDDNHSTIFSFYTDNENLKPTRLIIKSFASHPIDSSTKRSPSCIEQIVMERIGIESMVPLPPALLPANAKPAFTFSLFSKNFIVLSIPHPQIAKSTDNIPAPALPHTMLVVKFLTGSNRAEFIKEPYAGIDTVNHHDVDIFQTYGEIENIADSDVATISKIKNFNPVTGFDLLKKGKILPIFMLSQDLKFNITQSIAFTKLIFHEIQTNPKFTTSSLQLV